MTQATVIWLARHAEAHNPTSILYGRLPRVRLSRLGRMQAQALADYLARRPLAAVYSSPMLRARQTARLIAQRQAVPVRVRLSADLQEIRSAWQGRPLAELDRIGWDFYSRPRDATDETLFEIRDRMCRWVGRVLTRHAGREVAGVSHGDPILILLAQLTGRLLDLASIRPARYPPTGGVYRLEFDPAGAVSDIQLVVPGEPATAGPAR